MRKADVIVAALCSAIAFGSMYRSARCLKGAGIHAIQQWFQIPRMGVNLFFNRFGWIVADIIKAVTDDKQFIRIQISMADIVRIQMDDIHLPE